MNEKSSIAITRYVRTISSLEPTLAFSSMSTLEKILSNLVNEPTNVRFHKIGTKSATFKTKIENVEGALELLIEVGFRPVVIEFEQYYKINNVEEHIAFLKEVLVIIQERVLYCQERENISKARAINANKEEGEYVKLVHSLVVDDQKNREDKWGKK